MDKLLLSCVLLAGCAGGLSQPYNTPPVRALMVEESDAGKPIEVQPQRKLTIRLEANHSTGYRWMLATKGERLEQFGEPYYAGGAEYWTFMPGRAGTQELAFEYRRPWEKDKAAARALNYTVHVR
jgi:predicted secreted protein